MVHMAVTLKLQDSYMYYTHFFLTLTFLSSAPYGLPSILPKVPASLGVLALR